jgi:hypothetical protein
MKIFSTFLIAVAAASVVTLGGCSNQDSDQPPIGSISARPPRSEDGIKLSPNAKALARRAAKKSRVTSGK